MKHLIMGIPKGQNFPTFEIRINLSTEALAAIMKWEDENDWMFDYQLSIEQALAIAEIEGLVFPIDLDLFLTY